jgi:hypothetical protein
LSGGYAHSDIRDNLKFEVQPGDFRTATGKPAVSSVVAAGSIEVLRAQWQRLAFAPGVEIGGGSNLSDHTLFGSLYLRTSTELIPGALAVGLKIGPGLFTTWHHGQRDVQPGVFAALDLSYLLSSKWSLDTSGGVNYSVNGYSQPKTLVGLQYYLRDITIIDPIDMASGTKAFAKAQVRYEELMDLLTSMRVKLKTEYGMESGDLTARWNLLDEIVTWITKTDQASDFLRRPAVHLDACRRQ